MRPRHDLNPSAPFRAARKQGIDRETMWGGADGKIFDHGDPRAIARKPRPIGWLYKCSLSRIRGEFIFPRNICCVQGSHLEFMCG